MTTHRAIRRGIYLFFIYLIFYNFNTSPAKEINSIRKTIVTTIHHTLDACLNYKFGTLDNEFVPFIQNPS